MYGVTLPIAFAAGIVSFLSPCILPIVPGFLAYLAGTSAVSRGGRRQTFLNALFFVLGFAVVFAVLGIVLQTTLSHVAITARVWLSRVGGVIIILFGLYLAKILPIPFLDRDYKMPVVAGIHGRHLTSFLFGAAFAFGWTPCVGAVLGGILTLAVVHPGSAFVLLLAYTLGLGLPFLVAGAFAAAMQAFIDRYARVMQYVSIAFGVILIILGVLVFTQRLDQISDFGILNHLLPLQ